jgi:superfamily II DNA/RNA helicase
MLDMGFIPDIERICKLIPFTRQTLFFSATMPPEITRLTEQFLHAPVRIEVAKPASTAKTVAQRLFASGRKDFEKRDALRRIIRTEQPVIKNGIIFCNRKKTVADLFRSLERHGFSAGALHGDMDQRARMAMLAGFREGQLQLLVASDVAARGLDIPDVSHVFNFDVPIHAEDYVHRIGRTGRAGRDGKAFMIVTKDDTKHLAAIEALIEETIAWEDGDLSSVGESEPDHARPARAGARGGRGRKPAAPKAVAAEKAKEIKVEPTAAADGEADMANENAKPARSAPEKSGKSRSKRQPEGETRDGVVGFGDDLPDFMKTAIPL